MLPWKMLARFSTTVVLLSSGALAAAHELPVALNVTSTEIAAPPAAAAEPEPAVTVEHDTGDLVSDDDAPDDDAPDDDAAVADGSTPATPDVGDTATDPGPTPPPAPEKPAVPAAPAPAPVTPAPADKAAPAAAVTDDDGPAVCAAAAEKVCGPAAAPAPASGDRMAARVQRCQNWWNALAARLEQKGRPEWAARARGVAGRCEAMIARWQQHQARGEQKHKGDHNGDGHPDNGRGPKPGDRRTPKPKPQPDKVSRHSEGRQ